MYMTYFLYQYGIICKLQGFLFPVINKVDANKYQYASVKKCFLIAYAPDFKKSMDEGVN